MRRFIALLAAFLASLPFFGGGPPSGAAAGTEARLVQDGKGKSKRSSGSELKGRYAIAVANSSCTGKWGNVVNSLKRKYSGEIFKFDGMPDEDAQLRKSLAEYRPYYVCFVSVPEACGRKFVKSVTVLMRGLDDDPYDDAVWAILTGYAVDDAVRIASARPLEVRHQLTHVCNEDGFLEWFESGVMFSEIRQHDKVVRKKGGEPERVKGPPDTTQEWVGELNGNRVDLIATSGHATEGDWNMGYNYSSGTVRPAGKGALAGHSSGRKTYAIKTDNPKIYFSPGNCLIGHIPGRLDCMCLSWIHNGCNHFFGHTDLQAVGGCCAFGIYEYFVKLQDRYTFAEAVCANRIGSRRMLEAGDDKRRKELWERCLGITVLYGDPAWEARMVQVTKPLYSRKLEQEEAGEGRRKLTCRIRFNRDAKLERPPVCLLPFFISDWKIGKSDGAEATVADNFVLLDVQGKEFKKGDEVGVTLTCRVIE